MTRGRGSRLRLPRTEGKHRIEVRKSRVKVGKYIYRVVQVIDHTERDSRLIVEAPKEIRGFILAGLYKKLRN